MTIRLALAQINSTVGALTRNRDRALQALQDAKAAGAEVVVFPEMCLTGYPPEDLLLKPDFVDCSMQMLRTVTVATRGLTAIIGTLYADQQIYNAAAVLHDGELAGIYCKRYLPNYGVFDENRYFTAGDQHRVFLRNGIVFGVSICEDVWYPDGPPMEQALSGGAHLLINLSASPYHMGKGHMRERMLSTRAADLTSVVAYCNLVGGQDELVFDGQSLVLGPAGEILGRGSQFAEELLIVDVDIHRVMLRRSQDPRSRAYFSRSQVEFERIKLRDVPRSEQSARITLRIAEPLAPEAEIYRGLVLAMSDYARKNGFTDAVLGLSGGIDSALTAVIASDALGAEHVVCVAMPTRYSSTHSLEDARLLSKNLGCRLLEIPIDAVFQTYLETLKPIFERLPLDTTEENIQPRIRGTMLMALSNKFGWLVVTTGNKSEVGVGYSTLYGDTAGGFAAIKDVPKTLVYALSRYRNEAAGEVLIPQRILDKAPSAELRPEQKDSDSLPEYDILDGILNCYVQENQAAGDIVARSFDPSTVQSVIRLVNRNEYKRRQSPPGAKITPRAFGKDWRLPITNQYGG
jgi:NAD+ synthase (glutamine-hydrolysing)